MKVPQHQLDLFAAVGRAVRAVGRGIAAIWRKLLAIIRTTQGPARDYARARAVLRHVGPTSTQELRQRLGQLYRQGFNGAARVVAAFEPGVAIFEPPSETAVMNWLDRFIHPEQYNRIGTDNDKRLPEVLAQQMASDISQGKSQFEIAKNIRPFLDGSRMRAKRAARTFGMYVAHQGQLHAWEQAAEIVTGYTIHATLDQWTRPAHRARNGTTYHREPKNGQKGLGEMPHPPKEADGSIAWNCRCYLTPLV